MTGRVTDGNPEDHELHPVDWTAVLMCGGKGTRLETGIEKPLVQVDGIPMVDRVVSALADSPVLDIVAVVSPHTPETEDHLEDLAGSLDAEGVRLTVTPGSGAGYGTDLTTVVDRIGTPVVTVTADLPALQSAHVTDAIETALESADGSRPDTAVDSVTVCVPAAHKRARGLSVDTEFCHDGQALAPTGVNVMGAAADRVVVRKDTALAVNVNRPSDLRFAREFVGETRD